MKILHKDGYRINLDSAEWLYNPSLYESDRLTYIVNAFIMFSDQKYLKTHLLDTSVVDLKCFYNEDGTIKEAGNADTDGDTIYNTIEKWCKDNENLEVYAEERRIQEEKIKEEKEKAKRMEMCNSCQNKYGCSAIGKAAVCPLFKPFGV